MMYQNSHQLNNKQERNSVLKDAQRQKQINANIFINPDLSVAERHLAKQLRDEC
jgi:hypothetical protein